MFTYIYIYIPAYPQQFLNLSNFSPRHLHDPAPSRQVSYMYVIVLFRHNAHHEIVARARRPRFTIYNGTSCLSRLSLNRPEERVEGEWVVFLSV